MAVPTRFQQCLFAAVLAAASGACAAHAPRACVSADDVRASLAIATVEDDILVFRPTPPVAGSDLQPIELVRHRSDAGCRPEPVDRYEPEGGPPHLHEIFVHPVQGAPNLFAIVSWPIWHAGEGIRGTRYAVYAYRVDGDHWARNDVIVKHPALYGGIVGTVHGAPSTFEGTTRDGVVAMLHRLGLD